MLDVEEVRSRSIGQEVEQAEDTRGDVGASHITSVRGPRGQLHNEGDKVQTRGQSSVDEFLQRRVGDQNMDGD